MAKIATSPRKSKQNNSPKRSQQSKPIYRVKNWSAYNKALKQRGSLTVWFCEEVIQKWRYDGPKQRGAQFYYSDLAIETALTLRLIYDLPLRQHGYSKRRTWRKLHLAVNEATGEILASGLTSNSVDDASQVQSLLEKITDPIEKVSADGAYDKEKVYDTLADPPHQSASIQPVIPPRKDAEIWQHGNCSKPPLPRDETLRQIRKRERKRWKVENAYHRRSIAETEMARYKQIMGPKLRARKMAQQVRESRIGCKILNRMTLLGRPDSYLLQLAA